MRQVRGIIGIGVVVAARLLLAILIHYAGAATRYARCRERLLLVYALRATLRAVTLYDISGAQREYAVAASDVTLPVMSRRCCVVEDMRADEQQRQCGVRRCALLRWFVVAAEITR